MRRSGKISRAVPFLIGGVVSLILCGVYLQTLPSGLTWANFGVDGGDFVAAATTLGIPHPTGYPTYTLLSHLLLRLLPFGDPAYEAALFSALGMALGAGLFAALAAKVQHGAQGFMTVAALAAGIVLGLAPLLWSQAVIVEVHGLHFAFLSLGLWFTWSLGEGTSEIGWSTLLLAWAMGLGMGNHVTLALMIPAWVVLLALRWRRGSSRIQILYVSLAFFLGCSIYLYLPLRASAYPPVNWGVPNSWEGFLWTVTGRPYQGLAFGTPAGVVPQRFSAWARYLLESFGVVGVMLGILGLVMERSRSHTVDRVALWMLVIFSIFAVGYNTADSDGYLIPALLAFTWFTLNGINFICQFLAERLPGKWIRVGWSLPFLFLANTLIRFPATYESVDASDQIQAQVYGAHVMQAAPEHAVILTWEATDTFPLWYFQYSLGQRPDLAILVVPLMQFDWYYQVVSSVYPELGLSRDLFTSDAVRSGSILLALEERPRCQVVKQETKDLQLELMCNPPLD